MVQASDHPKLEDLWPRHGNRLLRLVCAAITPEIQVIDLNILELYHRITAIRGIRFNEEVDEPTLSIPLHACQPRLAITGG